MKHYESFCESRYSQFTFPGKPCETVRSILKAHGLRWNPNSKCWWMGRATGYADVCDALNRYYRKESGTPDGQCWKCKGANGFFRPQGAATPVYCDACYAEVKAAAPKYSGHESAGGPDVDRLYEDDCARACGL